MVFLMTCNDLSNYISFDVRTYVLPELEGHPLTKLNIQKYLLIASIYVHKVEVNTFYITYCLHWLLLFTSACSVALGRRWGSTVMT